jgi:hypothetical protein
VYEDEKSAGQVFTWKAEKGKTSKNFFDDRIRVAPYLLELAAVTPSSVDFGDLPVKFEKKFELDSAVVKANMIFLYKKGKVAVQMPGQYEASPVFLDGNYWVQDAEYIGRHAFDYQKYKAKALIIAKDTTSKTGIITETGNIVLPFEYTEINPNGSYLVLKKGSKTGFMILNTPYPFIPPVYDELHDYYSMPVKDNWSFGLFYITKNGKEGYVGENGMEFFKN